MIVDVTVLDLNDNPPVFVNKPYLAVVSKEAKANSPVITVTALDRDKGSNGDIYYQLVRGNRGTVHCGSQVRQNQPEEAVGQRQEGVHPHHRCLRRGQPTLLGRDARQGEGGRQVGAHVQPAELRGERA